MSSTSLTPAPAVDAAWFQYPSDIEPPLFCTICAAPATAPQVHDPCSSLCCSSCIERSIKAYEPCPSCQKQFSPLSIIEASDDAKKKLESLLVKCMGCDTAIFRKDFVSHAGLVCKFVCPNGCKKKITRAEWEKHDLGCSHKVIDCKNLGVGCTHRASRKDFRDHSCPFDKEIGKGFSLVHRKLTDDKFEIDAINARHKFLLGKLDRTDDKVDKRFINVETEQGVHSDTIQSQQQLIDDLITENATLSDRIFNQADLFTSKLEELEKKFTREVDTLKDRLTEQERLHASDMAQMQETLEYSNKYAADMRAKLQTEVMEFRMSVMGDLKKVQMESGKGGLTANSITSFLEEDFDETEAQAAAAAAASSPDISSPAPLSKVELASLRGTLSEHEERISQLELGGGVSLTPDMLTQLGMDPDDLEGSWDGGDDWSGDGGSYGDGDDEFAVDPDDPLMAEYLEAKAELESLRTQRASLVDAEEGDDTPHQNDELDWAMEEINALKQEYLTLTSDLAPTETATSIDDIIGAPEIEVEGIDGEAVDTLSPLPSNLKSSTSYAKKRFGMSRTPSTRMLDYLLSLPPDEEPKFDLTDVEKMKEEQGRKRFISNPEGSRPRARNVGSTKPILIHSQSGNLRFGKNSFAVVQLRPMRPSTGTPQLDDVEKERRQHRKDAKKKKKDKKKRKNSQPESPRHHKRKTLGFTKFGKRGSKKFPEHGGQYGGFSTNPDMKLDPLSPRTSASAPSTPAPASSATPPARPAVDSPTPARRSSDSPPKLRRAPSRPESLYSAAPNDSVTGLQAGSSGRLAATSPNLGPTRPGQALPPPRPRASPSASPSPSPRGSTYNHAPSTPTQPPLVPFSSPPTSTSSPGFAPPPSPSVTTTAAVSAPPVPARRPSAPPPVSPSTDDGRSPRRAAFSRNVTMPTQAPPSAPPFQSPSPSPSPSSTTAPAYHLPPLPAPTKPATPTLPPPRRPSAASPRPLPSPNGNATRPLATSPPRAPSTLNAPSKGPPGRPAGSPRAPPPGIPSDPAPSPAGQFVIQRALQSRPGQ